MNPQQYINRMNRIKNGKNDNDPSSMMNLVKEEVGEGYTMGKIPYT